MRTEPNAPWRFIDSGPGDAAYNMALDDALLHSVSAGQSPPVLRVYAWSGQSVSLGHSQRPERELNLALCREHGVRVVRRMTGGRAVWHEDELTYSFCGPADSAALGLTIAESWLLLARGILAALEILGVRAELVPAGGKDTLRGVAANPCFSSASRHEIVWSGRKLVGSAQRRSGGAFIQQGSFLLSNTQGRLLDFQPRAAQSRERERLERLLKESVAALDEASGRRVEYPEAAAAFNSGFARAFGVDCIPGAPTEDEIRLAEELARTRYAVPENRD